VKSTVYALLLAGSLLGSKAFAQHSARSEPTRLELWEEEDPILVRGQTPLPAPSSGPILGPIQDDTTTYYPPTYSPDPGAVMNQPLPPGAVPYGAPAPITADPWLGGGGMPYAAPSPMGPMGGYTYGVNGPMPYRFGWTARYDFGYLPSVGTSSPNVGSMSIFAADFEKEYVKQLPSSWVFSIAPQYNLRLWDGPRGTPGADDLPGNVHRFGLGMKLATPSIAGSSFEVGFNPALATDFQYAPNRDAFQFDAHAVWFWRWNPQFMVALGAAYWDRLDNIILPYAGVVWNPNDVLEFRLLFPKPRVSLFLGTPNGVATWAYLSGEYHVESYQIESTGPGIRNVVQLSDWRVLGGLRFESGWLTTFVEAGVVFDRQVEFQRVSSDFDMNSGFIGRAGFRY
jgi:hypothetical protein